jgi:thiosulfate dehydrogenase [quinone] large subunit
MTTTAARPDATVEAGTAVRASEDVVRSVTVRRLLGALRLTVGFIFLWAFLDKAFGFGYSTASENAWINGGKPSQGFLTMGAIGPLKDVFVSMASPATDVLFMLGMLGVGLAVSAVAGPIIMAMMWLAEWPLQSGSSNPLIDYHVIYAIALVIFAVAFAGDTWGLGRWWRELPIVRRFGWLR